MKGAAMKCTVALSIFVLHVNSTPAISILDNCDR
jgi:hypothetical protein